MNPDELVAFAESLARIAASGGGPKALAALLAQAAGGGVLVEDARWKHLAAAGAGNVPASARGVVESGAPGRAQRVVAGSQHVGWLSLFGSSLDGDADLLLRLTAAAIAVELARDAGARGRRTNFWEALLTGAYHEAAAARDDATAYGIALAPAYVAIALEVEAAESPAPGAAFDLRALVLELFRSGDGDVGIVERGTTLFIFVPGAREIDASNARTAATLLPKSVAKKTAHVRVCGGVGSVESPLQLAASAASAEAALAIGRRIYGGGHVVVYDDLGAYRLLHEGAGVTALQTFARGVLAPLRAYDEKHQTELEKTLKLYFALGQNVKTAAATLNVHRHTVFYRLRQIADICGRSLENPHDQLTLRLAIAIDELHESH